MSKKKFSPSFSAFFSVISVLFLLFAPMPAFSNVTSITSAQEQQIQDLLYSWRTRLNIPGAALGISLPGNNNVPITFVSGTTTMNGSQKITADTLFQAGSISKSFTSMIVLQLVAQGKIHLDDSITEYLPQYPQWQNVTVRELLNHTSGIFDYTKTGRFEQIRKRDPQAAMTPEEIVNMARAHRSYFPPGNGWKYSNTNYVLAGMIIEAVTKQPASNSINFYLHENPTLNLSNTFYLPGIYSDVALARMAHGYNSDGKDVITSNMSWAYTAGAIVSTTTDLLKWWQALFQNRILPKQQLIQMASLVCEHTNTNGCIAGRAAPHLDYRQVDKRYGLGIIQSAYRSAEVGTVWWHNGSTQGFKAIVMWFPQSDIYMALMIDRDPGFLLVPSLPIIRNIMHVILTGSYTPIAITHHAAAQHNLPHHAKNVSRHSVASHHAARHHITRHPAKHVIHSKQQQHNKPKKQY